MDLNALLASAMISFGAAYLFLPWLIRSLKGTSLVGKDLNKADRPLIPEMGGVGVILGFYVGITLLAAIALQDIRATLFFAALSACLGAGIVGLMDDMFQVSKRSKAILPFILAIALVVPLGVTSAANAANMLEGLNGLGAGLGVIMSFSLIVLSIMLGSHDGLFLLFPLLGALLAFLWFNRYPARVFPGDSMTLFTGATLACAAIIASPSLKTYGAFLFAPMILEFVLKSRGHFQGENYGELAPDGRMSWQGRIELLAHAVMRWKRLREWEIVIVLWVFEAAVCLAIIL